MQARAHAHPNTYAHAHAHAHALPYDLHRYVGLLLSPPLHRGRHEFDDWHLRNRSAFSYNAMRTARYSIQMSGVATVGPKCRACVPSSSSKCARIVRTYVCVQRAPYRMQPTVHCGRNIRLDANAIRVSDPFYCLQCLGSNGRAAKVRSKTCQTSSSTGLRHDARGRRLHSRTHAHTTHDLGAALGVHSDCSGSAPDRQWRLLTLPASPSPTTVFLLQQCL